MTVVLNSMRTQAFAPQLFTNAGVDPTAHRIVMAKSTQQVHAGVAAFRRQVGSLGAITHGWQRHEAIATRGRLVTVVPDNACHPVNP